ncbi:MAG: helix-turn-helix transcriptional regulator [Lachnospiraceae bacterium]|nr:helix-turn-helix transcriptional regulator [Lachnospiraceae bacterium]
MGDRRKNIQMVADETGLSRSTLSNLYHDKVTRIDLQTLDVLCKCLDCEPGDLLKRKK